MKILSSVFIITAVLLEITSMILLLLKVVYRF
ncbi:hypothetical protein HMPREF9630_00919 [Peptoanaerobacter stomatis]|uniref:Uncharacterized protein n=1 Tax=Peptoanaerobacter stomatis TaxID=796937 RepID=G9X2H2_9FIRM|nr:hypothetical protein HMPREF9629_00579 [Peptoanaerobacter stomatis]EHL14876.1 hypothetical protein HMPREF9630_00919 [Peptoanaerobacter stomatis]EHL18963.1 hypothetical protein HMPREF9628_01848 [Peptoanaerobacter stomatis]